MEDQGSCPSRGATDATLPTNYVEKGPRALTVHIEQVGPHILEIITPEEFGRLEAEDAPEEFTEHSGRYVRMSPEV